MNISSAKSPYLLQVERGNRPKATFGNRFRIAVDGEEAESQVTDTAEEEEEVTQYYDEEAEATSKIDKNEKEEEEENEFPYYNIKDEEAEYFLEKYGEKYDDNDPFKLFDELASKNIISRDDAYAASRKSQLAVVETFGYEPTHREMMNVDLLNQLLASGRTVMKGKFEKAVYGDSYDKYRKQNNTAINTWQDYVQDNYNYYKYISETDDLICDFDGVPYNYGFKAEFAEKCAAAERVQNVLSQIFGEVTL